jgi:Fic family protein
MPPIASPAFLGGTVAWPIAGLHLIAESARLGLRELDRLEAAAEKGRGLLAKSDRRSRLPDALDVLLRAPVLTPKTLAAQLKIAPQTATALLRGLQAEGVAREVTGRGSFRAFEI